MWLINTETLELEHVLDHEATEYAILSHTWEDGEVTFQEFCDRRRDENGHVGARAKKGWRKIERLCALTRGYGPRRLRYAWVDTCCIDKTSSAELSEAINSMYRWYADSAVCFAYLGDLAPRDHQNPNGNGNSNIGFQDGGPMLSGIARDEERVDDTKNDPSAPGFVDDIFQCRWWTRGWTLQELIAPVKLIFLDRDFNLRGTKVSLHSKIAERTGIEKKILLHRKPLASAHVARRMSWAAERQTTRAEDAAYSLMGIFDINMPLLYGEGSKAFLRLQEEICRRSNGDLTLFAWAADAPPVATGKKDRDETFKNGDADPEYRGILARHPREFLGAKTLGKQPGELHRGELSVTNKGIRIDGTELLHAPDRGLFLRLGRLQPDEAQPGKGNMYVQLAKTMDGYVRAHADRVFYGLASSGGATHWLPPENVYVASDLSPSDRDKVAKQRKHMVRFSAPAAPETSGRHVIRLGQATYPRHFWDRHESAALLDFASQQEGLVELVATLSDGHTTGRLVLAWSSYMAGVEGRRNRRQSALKYALLDARSPHWDAVSATLRGAGGGRAVDRLLRYEVLNEGPLVRYGEGTARLRHWIAGEEVQVDVTVSRPDLPDRWRMWTVEVSCGDADGGKEVADDGRGIQLGNTDSPEKRLLAHAATWKTF
ncbi:heterokaryon incompatibility protein-domain-containing protein [Apiospora rasikravindrae]|uniref:Heterokaryon incompatibility protein-domain-containing protein n=1 Tax=Apiospora rasikravindrae TaxID=990691 RepID=A0ABR1U891_9PEZI